jgi:hypothetical protein
MSGRVDGRDVVLIKQRFGRNGCVNNGVDAKSRVHYEKHIRPIEADTIRSRSVFILDQKKKKRKKKKPFNEIAKYA